MIGFIGGGNMAEAIIKGMIAGGIGDILVSEPGDDRRRYLEASYPVGTRFDNRSVVSSCDIIILAVKPQNMGEVIEEIHDLASSEKTVVSIAAGIPLSYLRAQLPDCSIIRVMPNTPALILSGMSVFALPEGFTGDMERVKQIFSSIGKVLILPERYMDTVTALSGSGPAFIAYFADAMIESGIETGLQKDTARELVVQTLVGTSRLLDSGMAPSALMKMVTSPGGTTEAGLNVYNEQGLMNIVSASIKAAEKRSRELGKQMTRD